MPPLPTVNVRRALGLAALVVMAVLAPAGAASAHAELLATNPADGSGVATAPDTTPMQFSESVSLRPDGVRVLDATGKRVDSGAASAAGADVSVPLDGTVANGTYVVAWRVVSADGHPVRGAYSFSVGEKTAVGSGVA